MDSDSFDKLVECLKGLKWQDTIGRAEYALQFMREAGMLTEEQWRLCDCMISMHNERMNAVRAGIARGVSPLTSNADELDRNLWNPRGPSSTT